jgi:hypothetical protein
MESALRVLGTMEGEIVKKLLVKLRGLVPEEVFLSLMSRIARELPSHALCLAALIILEPRSERAFDEAFRCFTELLSQATFDPEASDLADEVLERLSSTQLSQMNVALGACPREGGDRLDGLRLKEAYALLREGEVEAAICIANTLRMNPSLEKEVLRFYDEASLSSGKVLEQRLSAKLEELSRDSPSLAETISILHQLLTSELHFRKSEATRQSLISLKAEVLNEALANLGHQTSHALIAQDSRIQRLEEQTQRKNADCQETLASLRAMVGALTEDFVRAGQAASQTQIAQDAQIQRADAIMQECLISVKKELRALHELAAKAGAEAKRVQSFIEQSEKTEAATQEVLSSLRGEVLALSKDLEQAANQCKRAQLAQEATLRSIEGKSQSEAAAQEALSSLRDKVEALNGELLKAGEEMKSVKRAQDVQVQGLSEKFSKAEAATQQTLNILRGVFETLRLDLDQAWSQCKQAQSAQEAMLQRFEAQSEYAQAGLACTHGSDCKTYNRTPPTTTEETLQPTQIKPQHTPTFLYSCQQFTNQLHRVNLLTGEWSCHEVPHYLFKACCRWSEMPGGSLLITGGGFGVRDVVRLDVWTFAVSPQPPMHTARYSHAAVYHSQYVYVLGYSECERYSCAESQWEVLPALPVAGDAMSAVEVENSLYALGGSRDLRGLDTVQKLSLDSLTWQLMQLRLPQEAERIPCFKTDTQVYLVIYRTLYSFTPLQIKAVKLVDQSFRGSSSYYSRDTLYYEDGEGIYSLGLKLGS